MLDSLGGGELGLLLSLFLFLGHPHSAHFFKTLGKVGFSLVLQCLDINGFAVDRFGDLEGDHICNDVDQNGNGFQIRIGDPLGGMLWDE